VRWHGAHGAAAQAGGGGCCLRAARFIRCWGCTWALPPRPAPLGGAFCTLPFFSPLSSFTPSSYLYWSLPYSTFTTSSHLQWVMPQTSLPVNLSLLCSVPVEFSARDPALPLCPLPGWVAGCAGCSAQRCPSPWALLARPLLALCLLPRQGMRTAWQHSRCAARRRQQAGLQYLQRSPCSLLPLCFQLSFLLLACEVYIEETMQFLSILFGSELWHGRLAWRARCSS